MVPLTVTVNLFAEESQELFTFIDSVNSNEDEEYGAAAMVEPVVVMNLRRVVTGYRLRPNRLFVHIDSDAFRENCLNTESLGTG